MRKSLLTIIICHIGAMLLAGCGSAVSPASSETADESKESVKDEPEATGKRKSTRRKRMPGHLI